MREGVGNRHLAEVKSSRRKRRISGTDKVMTGGDAAKARKLLGKA